MKDVDSFRSFWAGKKEKDSRRGAVERKNAIETGFIELRELAQSWNVWLGKFEDYNDGIPKRMPEKRNYRLVEEVNLPGGVQYQSFALMPGGKIVAVGDGYLEILEKKVGAQEYSSVAKVSDLTISGKKIKLLPDGCCAVLARTGDVIIYKGMDGDSPKLKYRFAGEFRDFQLLPDNKLFVWGMHEMVIIDMSKRIPTMEHLEHHLSIKEMLVNAQRFSDGSIFCQIRTVDSQGTSRIMYKRIMKPGNEPDGAGFTAGWLAPPFQELPDGRLCVFDTHKNAIIAIEKKDPVTGGYEPLDDEEMFLDTGEKGVSVVSDFKILPNHKVLVRTLGNDIQLLNQNPDEPDMHLLNAIDQFAVSPDGRIFARSDYKLFIFDGEKV